MAQTLTKFSPIRFRFPADGPILLSAAGMSREEFFEFCQENSELRIERDPNGQIIIRTPTGSETGNRNSEILLEIGIWNRKYQFGKIFDSSTGFQLPNGAFRSPDVAWVANGQWDALSVEQKKKFAPLAPDFVIELRSEGQAIQELRQKMEEYLTCGCRLGWLIDPENQRTYVYDEHGSIQTVAFSETLSGGPVLPGLEVCLDKIL